MYGLVSFSVGNPPKNRHDRKEHNFGSKIVLLPSKHLKNRKTEKKTLFFEICTL